MKNKITLLNNTPFTMERFENGNIEIEFEQDIPKGSIMFCSSPSSQWVSIINTVVANQVHYFVSYNLSAKILKTKDWFRGEYMQRPATELETKKLFQAISSNGYVWDRVSMTLNEKEDKSIVPSTIGIFRLLSNTTPSFDLGDGLLISSGFENNLLCATDGKPTIFKNSICLFEKVKCRLIPCKYHELKVGDTAYKGDSCSDTFKVKFYVKILSKGYSYLSKDRDVQSLNTDFEWYKVVPIDAKEG